MNITTWADLTARSPDGLRTWLDVPTLFPDLALPAFPPNPAPWPGDPCSTRPGQFWRLNCGKDDWAWGGIFQILHLQPDRDVLTLQRWTVTSSGPARHHTIALFGQPMDTTCVDFSSRRLTRLIVLLARCLHRGTIRAEFPDTPSLGQPILPTWATSFSPRLRTDCSWSIYTDASWREMQPIPAESVFGIHGTHQGSGPFSSQLTFQIGARTFWSSDSTFPLFYARRAARPWWRSSLLSMLASTFYTRSISAALSTRIVLGQ